MTPTRRISLLILLLLLLVGCDKEKEKSATQVAARVDGTEITLSELGVAILRVPEGLPDEGDSVEKKVLEKLIDEHVAVRQALALKLDRDPQVFQLIEAAKREILARAYLERIAARSTQPTLDDASKYYAEHPELFAHRRIYSLEQLAIPATDSKYAADAKALVANGKSLNDIADFLKSHNAKFEATASVQTAEQLPMDLLSRYQKMRDGDSIVVDDPRALVIAHLLASREEPIDEPSALPVILKYLVRQRAIASQESEIKRLRLNAKVEYLGGFDKGSPDSGRKPEVIPPIDGGLLK